MDDSFTISAHYLRIVAEQVRRLGVEVEPWLLACGLTPAALVPSAQSATLRLDPPQLERLVLEAMRLTEEPAFGLLVGERLGANAHGILGYAAISSNHLRQGLELMTRYARLRTQLLGFALESRPRSVRLVITGAERLGLAQAPVLETVSLSLKNLIELVTGGLPAGAAQVAFPFDEPEYAAMAGELFGRWSLHYKQSWAGLELSAEALEAPLSTADPGAFVEAARICQAELDKLTVDESVATQVRRLLLERQHGFPSLAMVARLLHVSQRTLHRRLEAEGTSYRELLESVRHALALEHVKAERLSMEEIAYRLGYSDPANFRRAFKRWEQAPPSAVRAKRT